MVRRSGHAVAQDTRPRTEPGVHEEDGEKLGVPCVQQGAPGWVSLAMSGCGSVSPRTIVSRHERGLTGMSMGDTEDKTSADLLRL